jgi:hypothetical protein
MLGYALGRTLAAHRFTYFEFKRVRHVQKADAAAWASKSYA